MYVFAGVIHEYTFACMFVLVCVCVCVCVSVCVHVCMRVRVCVINNLSFCVLISNQVW